MRLLLGASAPRSTSAVLTCKVDERGRFRSTALRGRRRQTSSTLRRYGDVHRAARIAAAGHGGQVLVSSSASSLVECDRLLDLGGAPTEGPYRCGAHLPTWQGRLPPIEDALRTNLPVPATAFIGRQTELAELLRLLRSDRVRLVSVTGPSKTRLALQAAAEVADNYPDGIFWAALSALRDPDVVLPTIAASLESEHTPRGISATRGCCCCSTISSR